MKKYILIFLFFSIASFGFSQTLKKDSCLSIITPEVYFVMNPIAYLLKDSGGKLKIDDVLRMDSEFRPIKAEMYSFYQDDFVAAYWLRCHIKNFTPTSRYLFYFLPGLDTIESFIFNPDGTRDGLVISALEPTQRRPLLISQELVFPVVLQPGDTWAYFRIANRSIYSQQLNNIVVNLADEKSFINYFLRARHYQGIALGIITVMLVFHIFIYIFFRDRTYLIFVINIFITLIYLLLRKNYQEEMDWLTPILPYLRYVHDPSAMLLCFTVVMFSQSFLNTSVEDRVMHRIMNGLLVVLAAVTLCLISLQFLHQMNLLTIYLGFVTAVTVLIASIRSYMRGNKLALYAFFGFLIFLIVPLVYVIPVEAVMDFRNSESDFHYFAEAVRSLIFAVGIADRFYEIKKEGVRKEMERRQVELEKEKQLREEKERISRELHDNIGTQLTSLTQGLNRLVKGGPIHPEKVQELNEHVNFAMIELREMIWVMNKDAVRLEEFVDKINNLIWRLRQQDGSVDYKFESDRIVPEQTIQPGQAINLFRIVQESVNNSLKHSKADKIVVSLLADKGGIHLSICDNGIGFDLKHSEMDGCYGVANMNKRAREIKSRLLIDSQPGKGTTVAVDMNWIPMND